MQCESAGFSVVGFENLGRRSHELKTMGGL